MSLNSKESISKQHFTCQNEIDDLSKFIYFAKLEQLFVKISFYDIQAVLIPSKLILYLLIENEVNDAILKLVCLRIARYTFLRLIILQACLRSIWLHKYSPNLNIENGAFGFSNLPPLYNGDSHLDVLSVFT